MDIDIISQTGDPGIESLADLDLPVPLIPKLALRSGLYEHKLSVGPIPIPPIPERNPIPIPQPDPGPWPGPGPDPAVDGTNTAALHLPVPTHASNEEVRLDVDGRYPQMTVSGTIRVLLSSFHWIANLTPTGPLTYAGSIWFKDGSAALFPYTNVAVVVTPSIFPNLRSVIIRFTGGGATPRIRAYAYKSAAFHTVDFEFDSVEGEAATLSFNTGSHPNRPANLPVETLTVRKVFERAGFAVTTSAGSVPLTGAGANAQWSDMEMHDAMQTYWSKNAPKAQWALWVFFASLHEAGTGLGGIMFDDIGAQHRQGTAIFNDSFISQPPAGDPNGAAHVQRMIFWTACHEMGHGFNMAHSWQKALEFDGKGPWIPGLANDPEARSFMNYPYRVAGGSTAFFGNFEYRFSDPELLFLRHAPARYVRMGDAAWFDHHGFEGANILAEPTFELTLRVNREAPAFEFLEVVTAELKLTNTSGRPQIFDPGSLALDGDIVVLIKKGKEPARRLVPLARYCRAPEPKVLMPGESIYAPLVLSVGRNGWDIATPGRYDVCAVLQLETGEDIVSNPLRVKVAPPKGYDEEYLADDYFSDEVGRTLAFGGSQYFDGANDTLRELAERLGDRRAAVHAKLALGRPLAIDYKQLSLEGTAVAPTGIHVRPAQIDEAEKLLTDAITTHPEEAAETLGHICFKATVDRVSEWLVQAGATREAARQQQILLDTLSSRVVHGRPILASVLDDIKATLERYKD